MTEQRLSCIALLSIESELTNSINVDQLADIFAKLIYLRDTTGELATTNVCRLELYSSQCEICLLKIRNSQHFQLTVFPCNGHPFVLYFF